MQNFSTLTWISIFAISAMLVNSLGIWFIYKHQEWAEKSKEYFMCFAAGVLITSPLIMAFPQAVAKNPDAGLAALTGFIFMFFSNRLIKHRTRQPELAFGITALEGIGIHFNPFFDCFQCLRNFCSISENSNHCYVLRANA